MLNQTKRIWRKDNVLLKDAIGILETKLCSKDYDTLEDIFIPRKSYLKNYSVLKDKNIKKKIYKESNMLDKVINSVNSVIISYSE